jgi:hypothetical protein
LLTLDLTPIRIRLVVRTLRSAFSLLTDDVLSIRVDNPIVPDSQSVIPGGLQTTIVRATGRRKDLDDKQRRSFDGTF